MSTGRAGDSRTPTFRSRGRGITLAIAGLVVIALGFGAATVGPSLVDGNEYATVASIELESTYRDPVLLRSAWLLPVAARYKSGGFEYQSNPSFCGPASVANIVHSLGGNTSQKQVVENTEHDSWFGILPGGLTLDEVADLLRHRTARPVTILRDTNLAQFRDHMRSSNDLSRRYIVNFHRGPLFARGHGHFSPVLGYLEAQDLVLVGDTNRKYRPFLVQTARLWKAVRTVDGATGRERGVLVVDVEAAPRAPGN